MRIEQYLTFTDHTLWEVIVNGNSVSLVASASTGAEDLEQTDTDNLEEIDIKWQVAMLNMRVKRFIKKIGMMLDLNGKETVGCNRTKVECYNCHRKGHFIRDCRAPRNQRNRNIDALTKNAPVNTYTTNALVVQDGIGYQTGLESLEARIVVHKKNEAVYEEDISFLKYDVQVKDISIKEIKNRLENALKEKDDLKLKLEKFETYSKNLTKQINSQISAIDKTDLGYDGQMNESDLNDIYVNKNKVLNNVVDSRESDGDDNQVNNRFKKGEGYHVVPSPCTRNYMPPRADLSFAGLDNYVFKSKVSETITSVPKIETNASKTSKDSLEKSKTIRSSAPLIEEHESDSEEENVFKPKEVTKTVKPSLEKIEFINARNTDVEKENKVEKPRKFSQSPRDCDFYENKMVLNNKRKITGPKEIRPVWDNTARVNHQNKLSHPHPKRNFVLATVLTKSEQVPVNAAKQSSHKVATLVSAARRVNTTTSRPNVNNTLPTTYSYFKAHSPGNLQYALQDQGIFDSGCSKNVTGNKSYLTDYQEIDSGFVAFGRNAKGVKITRKGIENQMNHKVKTIKCDNKTKFKNRIMNEFCEMNGIRREFSVARTPQQNGVIERKNRTLIEAAKTMLADSKLPTTFWAKAVNTSCYVQNRVLVIKPHNKTPYELFLGRKPALSFMRPFGCPVIILNTLDQLDKFDEKSNDSFFIGYSINSKAFKVFNTRTRFVEGNLHINFLENKPNVTGTVPN
uniref:Retrovirus-related Pol polyprotein from transposon TNT 1-94 n=1 Tax=Tanacetum cinerariifolium TaxID=118510 RepID=A0A6L2LDX7_TANCI|nr:retrovirus-related Pol polyprotein from transposon TNT 1-94 [Tanacetum cinerariifolium]